MSDNRNTQKDASRVPVPDDILEQKKLRFISAVLLRILYFLLGFFLALGTSILFVRFSGILDRGNLPSIIIRHHTIHDTIPVPGFQSSPLPDTLSVPTVWQLWNYEDSILMVRFEAPIFRNFQYWLTLPELIATTSSTQGADQPHLGSLSLTANWNNANLTIGYKHFALGVQYRYTDRLFLPLLGVRISF